MTKKRMSNKKFPVTMGIRELNKYKATFEMHLFEYEEHGGAGQCTRELGVDGHLVIKTLIMEDEKKNPLVILMHGDREVSTKNLARIIRVKSVTPCPPEKAEKITGYKTGGISPFGIKSLPVYMEKTIQDHERIYINGGKRGFILEMNPQEIVRILNPTPVNVGI